MPLTITPAKLKGPVIPPPSKSQAHRLLIAAALAGGESVIHNVAYSADIEATISCGQAALHRQSALFLRKKDALFPENIKVRALGPLHQPAVAGEDASPPHRQGRP